MFPPLSHYSAVGVLPSDTRRKQKKKTRFEKESTLIAGPARNSFFVWFLRRVSIYIPEHRAQRCAQPWHHHEEVGKNRRSKFGGRDGSIGYCWIRYVYRKTAIVSSMYLIIGISTNRDCSFGLRTVFS
jgi:hypothetical protein